MVCHLSKAYLSIFSIPELGYRGSKFPKFSGAPANYFEPWYAAQ